MFQPGDDGILSALFTCEDYREKIFRFQEYEITILCSNMSMTDHDLTGQIVWPAAVVLAWFIYSNKDKFNQCSVLELGAGCGLAGFFSTHFSKEVIITDGNELVLRLLQQNRDHVASPNVVIRKLIWGRKQEVEETVGSFGPRDVIIGADIILWPLYVLPLIQTVRWLLSCNPRESVCYISYVVRATSTTELFLRTAESFGLEVKEIPGSLFLPPNIAVEIGVEGKLIYEMRIRSPDGVSLETEPVEDSSSQHNEHGAPY